MSESDLKALVAIFFFITLGFFLGYTRRAHKCKALVNELQAKLSNTVAVHNRQVHELQQALHLRVNHHQANSQQVAVHVNLAEAIEQLQRAVPERAVPEPSAARHPVTVTAVPTSGGGQPRALPPASRGHELSAAQLLAALPPHLAQEIQSEFARRERPARGS